MDESVVKHLEQQQITKLSQAIREGAKLRPQCTGFTFRDGRSCALGAAYEAAFGYPTDDIYFSGDRDGEMARKLHEKFNIPWSFSLPREVGMYMNDAGMTREAIADRLEAIGY